MDFLIRTHLLVTDLHPVHLPNLSSKMWILKAHDCLFYIMLIIIPQEHDDAVNYSSKYWSQRVNIAGNIVNDSLDDSGETRAKVLKENRKYLMLVLNFLNH